MTIDNWQNYVNIAVLVCFWIFKNKIFITPSHLEEAKKEILKEAEKKYVNLVAYQEFRHATEKRLDELLTGINDIKNFLMNKNK